VTVKWTSEELEKAVDGSNSLSQCLRKLGVGSGAVYVCNVLSDIALQGFDTSHFKCQPYRPSAKNNRPLSEILTESSDRSTGSNTSLKTRLLREGIFDYRCNECHASHWQDKPIVLHMDHIDGNPRNNKIENLRLLCPNCHSQTETYCGRNYKSKKTLKRACVDCGVDSVGERCLACRRKADEKINWPTNERLREMMKEKTAAEVASDLGVNRATLFKRLKRHS